MSCTVLHHFEICVLDEREILSKFLNGFGFTFFGRRETKSCSQWVVRSGHIVFVITKRENFTENRCCSTNGFSEDDLRSPDDLECHEDWTVFCCGHDRSHSIDSVFNVALVVSDVDKMTRRLKECGVHIIRDVREISDEFGSVKYSIVKSCVGNVVHTLIDKSEYSGLFLPSYSVKECPSSPSPLTTFVDHVTFVCDVTFSKDLIDWYERCFGMKRFLANSKEDLMDGFVLEDNIGLRMKAMEYWRCAETGLTATQNGASGEDNSLKIVIAEPLPQVKTSHVQTFLNEHGGPGIQHIGLHSDSIIDAVDAMSQNGIKFRVPPPTYYQECGKLGDIVSVSMGSKLTIIERLGILLDAENDEAVLDNPKRYLMQIFSQPLFMENTFFMEVIQRCGAKGFGAGNITALAASIAIYEEQMHRL